MRGLAILAAALLVGTSGTASPGVVERNVAYFLDALGLEVPPEGEAEVTANGVTTRRSATEALRLTAERARGVDLDVHVPAPDPRAVFASEDVWVIETGVGPCPEVFVQQETFGPIWFIGGPVHQIYGPYAGVASSVESTTGRIIDWGSYSGTTYDGRGATIAGQSDLFCLSFFGLYLWFPFVSGVAYVNLDV